jgi:hypothetical protein
VQKPTGNSGFFVVYCPKTCYKIYQNPASLRRVYFEENTPSGKLDTPPMR